MAAPDDASLPPLPDGGLAAVLPDWLREPPIASPQPPLLIEADLPPWLLALADRDDSGPDLPAQTAANVPDPPRVAPLFLPDAPLLPPGAAALKSAPVDATTRDREQDVDRPAHRQRVGLAAAALLVVLALLILFAWASGVRLLGLS